MAVTIQVNVAGPPQEEQVVLDALQWAAPKRHYTDAETGEKRIDNPMNGLALNQTLKQVLTEHVRESVRAYLAWQQQQQAVVDPPQIS